MGYIYRDIVCFINLKIQNSLQNLLLNYKWFTRKKYLNKTVLQKFLYHITNISTKIFVTFADFENLLF